jgi:hypothetical protein
VTGTARHECAATHGWIVPDEHASVDDGISGAEFASA